MQKTILTLSLSGLLSLLPLAAAGAEVGESEAYETVHTMLAQGSPHGEVIAALRGTEGMSLPEATVFAVVSGGEANQVDFALAGLAAAATLEEAETVVAAVLAAAGENGPVADAVNRELLAYRRRETPPPGYGGHDRHYGGCDWHHQGCNVSPST
jgi:hypothetical protein